MIAARLNGLVKFWYRFFVGDDWIVAAGVVVALGLTYLSTKLIAHTFWIVPAVALILLAASVFRAAGTRKTD